MAPLQAVGRFHRPYRWSGGLALQLARGSFESQQRNGISLYLNCAFKPELPYTRAQDRPLRQPVAGAGAPVRVDEWVPRVAPAEPLSAQAGGRPQPRVQACAEGAGPARAPTWSPSPCNSRCRLARPRRSSSGLESFDSFNRPHFGSPVLSIGNRNAGVIGGAAQDNRQLQFGQKRLF